MHQTTSFAGTRPFATQLLSYLTFCCALSLFGQGTEASASEKKHRDAHVHGEGQFNVVAVDAQVLIELEIPAINVVGFEHEASTLPEHKAIAGAQRLFANASGLFTLTPSAQCKLADARVRLGKHDKEHLHGKHEKEEHAHGKHEKEEHAHGKHEKEEHAHGKHDKAKDEHSDKSAHEPSHSSLLAAYIYQCETPRRLIELTVHLFEKLPTVRTLRAQVVTGSNQTRLTLSPGTNVIPLKR